MSEIPRITFGMIVLNGEPFLRYNLRALYPLAYQIIVVEGAAPGSANIATSDGHSIDGTLDALRDFKSTEDIDDKLIIVTAEDVGHSNGFWPGEKHEQSQAYAERASGDYLWQVDVDEFYKLEDMKQIIHILKDDPSITAMSFKMIMFWGGFDYITDGWYLRRGEGIFHRLFRWGAGYEYKTHRPPTVIDNKGQDQRKLCWISGKKLARDGIYLYHYSFLFPKQVIEKCSYYAHADWAKRENAEIWAQENYLKLGNPFRVHNVYDFLSWLDRYKGSHPQAIEFLKQDIDTGKLEIEMRAVDDIESILGKRWYIVLRQVLIVLAPINKIWHNFFLYWWYQSLNFVLKVILRNKTLSTWYKRYKKYRSALS